MGDGGAGSVIKVLAIGCGAIILLGVIAIVGLFVWIGSKPEGGVKLANEMEPYALSYLEKHQLLEPGETLLAYYDATMSMDGSEAAILTDRRVLYHKDGRTTALDLKDVERIDHREEGLVGDVFEIHSSRGEAVKIEIAPLNQGATFKNVLDAAWNKARAGGPPPEDPAPAPEPAPAP